MAMQKNDYITDELWNEVFTPLGMDDASNPLPAAPDGYRVFAGGATRQVDGITGRHPSTHDWFFEPVDYEGDTLWSEGYATRQEAIDAAYAYRENHNG